MELKEKPEIKSVERFKQEKSTSPKALVSRFGSLLGLLLLCLILAVTSPQFASIDNIMNIASQASINCVVSAGMLLTILTAGIDLSVGSILAFSTCLMGIAYANWHWNPILTLLICILAGAFLGFVNGLMLTKLHLPHPFISTLGMKNIASGLALIITAATPISGFSKSMQFLGANYIGPVPVSFILVIILFICFSVFLNRTKLGRNIYAVGGNLEAAKLSGINVSKVLVSVYTICGCMSALAGIVLIGRVNSAFPLAGLNYDTDAIAACIIGGASFMGGSGTIWGTLIGAMIMTVLRNGLNLLGVSADLQTVAIGSVIIGAVYVDVLRRRAEKKAKAA